MTTIPFQMSWIVLMTHFENLSKTYVFFSAIFPGISAIFPGISAILPEPCFSNFSKDPVLKLMSTNFNRMARGRVLHNKLAYHQQAKMLTIPSATLRIA